MCARVYSKLKAFNVKRWPTYTANVGFSTSQPHALKREIYLMMSLEREVESRTREAAGQREKNGPQVYEFDTDTHMFESICRCQLL